MTRAITRLATPLAIAALLGALALASGCWRVHYTSDRPRGVTHVATETYFVYGLVGDTVIDVRELCPGGVAEIIRFAGPVNVVLWVLTLGIYTPAQHAVTCAAVFGDVAPGPSARAEPRPPSPSGASQ